MDDGNFVESVSGRERVRPVGGESASKHEREGEREGQKER